MWRIDLVFYHLKLHSYVIIDIKAGKFKPALTGQLGLYMTVVDAEV